MWTFHSTQAIRTKDPNERNSRHTAYLRPTSGVGISGDRGGEFASRTPRRLFGTESFEQLPCATLQGTKGRVISATITSGDSEHSEVNTKVSSRYSYYHRVHLHKLIQGYIRLDIRRGVAHNYRHMRGFLGSIPTLVTNTCALSRILRQRTKKLRRWKPAWELRPFR